MTDSSYKQLVDSSDKIRRASMLVEPPSETFAIFAQNGNCIFESVQKFDNYSLAADVIDPPISILRYPVPRDGLTQEEKLEFFLLALSRGNECERSETEDNECKLSETEENECRQSSNSPVNVPVQLTFVPPHLSAPPFTPLHDKKQASHPRPVMGPEKRRLALQENEDYSNIVSLIDAAQETPIDPKLHFSHSIFDHNPPGNSSSLIFSGAKRRRISDVAVSGTPENIAEQDNSPNASESVDSGNPENIAEQDKSLNGSESADSAIPEHRAEQDKSPNGSESADGGGQTVASSLALVPVTETPIRALDSLQDDIFHQGSENGLFDEEIASLDPPDEEIEENQQVKFQESDSSSCFVEVLAGDPFVPPVDSGYDETMDCQSSQCLELSTIQNNSCDPSAQPPVCRTLAVDAMAVPDSPELKGRKKRADKSIGLQVDLGPRNLVMPPKGRTKKPKASAEKMDAMELKRISIAKLGQLPQEPSVRTRATRTRIAPLKWWMGEHVQYKRDDLALPPTISAVVRAEKIVENVSKRGGSKSPRLAIRDVSLETEIVEARSNISAIVRKPNTEKKKANRKQETEREAFLNKLEVCSDRVNIHNGNPVVISRPKDLKFAEIDGKGGNYYKVAVEFEAACFTSCQIRVSPNRMKGSDNTRRCIFIGSLLAGESLKVFLSLDFDEKSEADGVTQRGFPISVGDTFLIPAHTQYNFINESSRKIATFLIHVLPPSSD